ncbi:MAG: cation:proton antiporter [Nanoarchaeota archaeon]
MFVIAFLVIIISSFLFVYLLNNFFKIPKVVALILFGILCGITPFREVILQNENIIMTLGFFGLFFLLFLAGLESSFKNLEKEEKDSIWIGIYSLVFPLIIGFIISKFVLNFDLIASLVIAICLSFTAEATKVEELMELGKLKTKIGSAMVGAGFIDDTIGILLFSVLLFSLGQFYFIESMVLILGVLFFIIGILLHKFAREHHITKKLEVGGNNIFLPFFFVSMGLAFDFSHFVISPLVIIVIIMTAIAGKLVGALLARPHLKQISYKQLYLIGWGMNARGAVELAITLIAFEAGLISSTIYSALVFMALITTIIFPYIISRLIVKNPSIMD